MSYYDILFLWSLQALTFASKSVHLWHAEPISDGVCVHEPLQRDLNIEIAKLFLERDA